LDYLFAEQLLQGIATGLKMFGFEIIAIFSGVYSC